MPVEDSTSSRSLHEWYDYIQAERARGVTWRTRLWWVRQWLHRVGTAERLRTWWKNARSHSNTYASLVHTWTGRSRTGQLLDMALLKIHCGVTPKEYYTYKLYRSDRYEKAGQFVGHDRQVRLMRYLIDRVYDEDRPTRNKRLWHKWADKQGISTPRVFAVFSEEQISPWRWDGNIESLPSVDLFCKWTNRWRGEGAECWLFRQGRYVNMQDKSTRLNRKALVEHLKRRSRERPVLLQERVCNHPAMQGYTSGGLATSRLVTGRFPGEEPRPIVATLKMPIGDSIVDNGSGTAVTAPIDLENATLGPAVSDFPEPAGDVFHVHPDTGAQITGTTFPFWDDVVSLAIDTHRKLPEVPFVGWDITVTGEGPMVVEPNDGWGASGTEKPSGIPLTDTLYQPMYDAWMRCRSDG